MRNFWGHWLLLAGGLILFVVAAPMLPPSWERIELPQQETTTEEVLPSWQGPPLTAYVPPPLRPIPPDPSAQAHALPGQDAPERILLLGDSMIEWFAKRFARWCRASGYALYTVIWPSSNLIWWGTTDTLRAFIERFNPTYVLICVGGNELFIPRIEKRRPHLQHILAQIQPLPYVWIGPPAWKPDMGICAFLEDVNGPGRYYGSSRLTLERLSDGAHPTPSAAYRWADSVVAYLRDSALYPLNFPLEVSGQPSQPHYTILLSPHAP